MQGFSSLLRAVLQVSVIKSKVNKISLYLNQEWERATELRFVDFDSVVSGTARAPCSSVLAFPASKVFVLKESKQPEVHLKNTFHKQVKILICCSLMASFRCW